MSAESKKHIRKLAPIAALLAFAALLGVAGASTGPSAEFTVATQTGWSDSNSFLIFQPAGANVGPTVNNIEINTSASVLISVTNKISSTTTQVSYVPAMAITPPFGVTLPSTWTPTFTCYGSSTPSTTCNGYYSGNTTFFYANFDTTGWAPGTYSVQFTATDPANTGYEPGSSQAYYFVVSSSAATLAKNSLSASTLMTINLTGTKMIYAAMPVPAAASASTSSSSSTTLTTATDSTTGTRVAYAGAPFTLILNNVGTSTIVVSDGNNIVTLGVGDVIAAVFAANVTASVVDGPSGSLRVGLP
jgi:hypothetical protein